MRTRRTEIIKELEKGLEETTAFYQSLHPEQLGTHVYDDPAWTVKQALAHFITIEKTMHWLFNDILSGGRGSPENFILPFGEWEKNPRLSAKALAGP